MNAHHLLIPVMLFAFAAQAGAQTLSEKLKKAAEQAKIAADKASLVAKSAGTLLPIDATKETEIGRGIAATVAGRYTLSNDSVLTEYVNLVGLVVAGEVPRTDIAYRFGVLETLCRIVFTGRG